MLYFRGQDHRGKATRRGLVNRFPRLQIANGVQRREARVAFLYAYRLPDYQVGVERRAVARTGRLLCDIVDDVAFLSRLVGFAKNVNAVATRRQTGRSVLRPAGVWFLVLSVLDYRVSSYVVYPARRSTSVYVGIEVSNR